jgi:short-subunit dehydrogenase
MKISPGQTVLLTGASGGLGTYLAKAFAELGTHLMLVAFPGAGLEDLKQMAEQKGVRAVALAADLRDPEQRRLVMERTLAEFGGVDILINNAGVEFTSRYHELPEETVLDILRVNLEAPMVLTHMVLPHLLKRKAGFIVNMSSLAGKCGPAFQEPYAASKAGLVAFTSSLRATYRGSGVSASVICPGFVEAGIYTRLKETTGCVAPPLLGTSKPETVVRAVIRSIEKDLPEVIISRNPFRPLLGFIALFPSAGEWVLRQTGAHDFFGKVAEAQSKGKTGSELKAPGNLVGRG